MDFIIDNRYLILAVICGIVVCVTIVYKFFGLPTATQLQKVKEWLLWAVTEAEKDLGAGTCYFERCSKG